MLKPGDFMRRFLIVLVLAFVFAVVAHAQPVPSQDQFNGTARELEVLGSANFNNQCNGANRASIQDCFEAWDLIVTGGGTGTDIFLDIGTTGVPYNSNALSGIATTGDTHSIFTESPSDVLKIDASKNWPSADSAVTAATASALAVGGLSALNMINNSLCTEGKIFKVVGGVWTCANDADSGAAPLFSSIGNGVNVSATMTVGTGASLVASGSGTIRATEVELNSVALLDDTTGNYVAGATASQGLTLTGTEAGSLGIQTCADGQIMKSSGGTSWICASDNNAGVACATSGTSLDIDTPCISYTFFSPSTSSIYSFDTTCKSGRVDLSGTATTGVEVCDGTGADAYCHATPSIDPNTDGVVPTTTLTTSGETATNLSGSYYRFVATSGSGALEIRCDI